MQYKTRYFARVMRLPSGRFIGYVGQECYGKPSVRLMADEFMHYESALKHAEARLVPFTRAPKVKVKQVKKKDIGKRVRPLYFAKVRRVSEDLPRGKKRWLWRGYVRLVREGKPDRLLEPRDFPTREQAERYAKSSPLLVNRSPITGELVFYEQPELLKFGKCGVR